MSPSAPERPPRPQITLAVQRREQLSGHIVRLVLGGDQFDHFVTNDYTDKYVKILFAQPRLQLRRPYDLAVLRETLNPEDMPVTRTYTIRELDHEARTLSIDFVVHGDQGLAGPFAYSAKPGDEVTFTGPGGGYAPDPTADWHLFAGDQSALPAIASSISALPRCARGLAFIEVSDAQDIYPLDAPDRLEVRWLYSAQKLSLATAMQSTDWPNGRPQVFAHGERSAMKELRDLFTSRGVLRSQLSLSGYWAEGRTEDRFQAEKREPIGIILPVLN